MPTNWRTGRKVHVPRSVDEIMRLEGIGLRRAKIAELLGISESSVYRIVIRERRRKASLAPPARRITDRRQLGAHDSKRPSSKRKSTISVGKPVDN